MNLGAVIESSLTVPQLRQMLGAAKADYAKQIKTTMLRWQVETTALKKAMAQRMAQSAAELQTLKNNNIALRRELDAVHDELLKANITITEQSRKLAAHNSVVELEQKLHAARARMAS